MPHLPLGPLSSTARREESFQRRVRAASQYLTAGIPENRNNGDEDLYSNKIGNFTKGLHHNNVGEVDVNDYNTKCGSYLLPLAFPEGSPMHPAYGAGHATVAGACVTMLKALFDEEQVIPNPEFVDGSGNRQPWVGPGLKVGDELNKLASNVAIGRNFAGVHW